jgi:NAD(P)-dependent dehydrogenase (short-subunit alcohol dehydrogenase family)
MDNLWRAEGPMDLGLRGKGAVVTGASKGIGRAIALGLAREGANIAICARGEDALREVERELSAHGVKVWAGVCDVGDPAALDEFLESGRQALGSISVLVNNASGFAFTDDEAGCTGASTSM